MSTAAIAAFHESIDADLTTVASRLQERLGQRLVAYIVGQSPKTIGRWARAETTDPHSASVGKLRAVYRISVLFDNRSDQTFRAWMSSPNPWLGEEIPADVLRAGAPERVFNAAQAFIEG